MTSTYTVTGDIHTIVDANAADTKYIIAEGGSITLPSGFAIDATSDAAGRSFEINGHLSGNVGLALGNDYTQPSGVHVTVGATGLINSVYDGILSKGDGAVITNHGEIDSYWGIDARGENLSITNTGTINATAYGLELGTRNADVHNSGTISGGAGIGIGVVGYLDGAVTIVNTGTISGQACGIQTFYGDDTVINKGIVDGKIDLYAGDDLYDGKYGVVHGLIDGNVGDDHLKGGSQSDQLSGGLDHDVLTGRGGADVFIFSTGFDADEFTDFQVSGNDHDKINLSAMKGFGSFGDLKGHMHENGGDAVLDFGHGDVLTLDHVNFHDLSKADFLF